MINNIDDYFRYLMVNPTTESVMFTVLECVCGKHTVVIFLTPTLALLKFRRLSFDR